VRHQYSQQPNHHAAQAIVYAHFLLVNAAAGHNQSSRIREADDESTSPLRIAHSNDYTVSGKEEPGRRNGCQEIDGACSMALKIKPSRSRALAFMLFSR
jgi:hypothetical protein